MGCYIYWEPVLQTRTKPDRDTLMEALYAREDWTEIYQFIGSDYLDNEYHA